MLSELAFNWAAKQVVRRQRWMQVVLVVLCVLLVLVLVMVLLLLLLVVVVLVVLGSGGQIVQVLLLLDVLGHCSCRCCWRRLACRLESREVLLRCERRRRHLVLLLLKVLLSLSEGLLLLRLLLLLVQHVGHEVEEEAWRRRRCGRWRRVLGALRRLGRLLLELVLQLLGLRRCQFAWHRVGRLRRENFVDAEGQYWRHVAGLPVNLCCFGAEVNEIVCVCVWRLKSVCSRACTKCD